MTHCRLMGRAFTSAVWAGTAMLLVVVAMGCAEKHSDEPEPVSPTLRLWLDGESSRTLGLGQLEEFLIVVSNEDGLPVKGAVVTAAFEGSVHGGVLRHTAVESDEKGRVYIALEAPAAPAKFVIRFNAPTAREAVWATILVDPQQIGFWVELSHAGVVELAAVRLSMYEGLSCEDAPWSEPTAWVSSASAPPETLRLAGANEGKRYALLAQGLDRDGVPKASRCLGDLKPSSESVKMLLQDLTLAVAGDYLSRIEMEGDALALAVDYLEAAMNHVFVDQWPAVLLNGMHNALAVHDGAAAARFAAARELRQFDSAVLPSYAAERGIDFETVNGALFDALRQATSRVVLRGRVFVEHLTSVSSSFTHTVVSASLLGGEKPLAFSVSPPAVAQAFLSLVDGANTHFLSGHSFEIGLGTVLRRGLELIITDVSGDTQEGLATALEGVIDCPALTDRLAPYLDDAVFLGALTEGCRAAIQGVEQNLLLATQVMDEGRRLELGSVVLALDVSGKSEAAGFVGGSWNSQWAGTALSWGEANGLEVHVFKLGPMPTIFLATRVDERTGNGEP